MQGLFKYFEDLPWFQALSRALNFKNRIQAISRIFQALYGPCSPLLKLTCHMGSHSVTYHPAEVIFPSLLQPKLVLDLATPWRCMAKLIYAA